MSRTAGPADRDSSLGIRAKITLTAVSLVATVLLAEGVARLLLPVQQVVEVEPATSRHSHPGSTEEREQERNIDGVMDWSGNQGVRLHPRVRATIRNPSPRVPTAW